MYDHILVAVDGSQPSRYAGQAAVAIAAATGARITACHVYGAEIHRQRFGDMEPGLPSKYQQGQRLSDLRTAHDRLMHEGFRVLSAGYVEDFVASCRDAGNITIESAAAEGRSYVGILNIARTLRCDLIVLGADGLGSVGNGMLGGTTTRVLQSAPVDVLVARREPDNGPILVGVDGSEAALKSVGVAAALGRTMNRPVHLTASYDPDFHTRVFSVMAQSLSPDDQEKIGLTNQEKLHDDIINSGLGKLYAEFLKEAQQQFNGDGIDVESFLVTGKAYCALLDQAEKSAADLIVVNRYGHHREQFSRLGSNAEGLLRTTSANVLLVGGVDEKLDSPKAMSHPAEVTTSGPALEWDGTAASRLERVPSFVRSMAKRAVENAVRASGGQRVSADDFDSVAAQFGMGSRGGGK